MKCHFIEQFTKPDEKISIYKTGKFLDFCRGPHIPSTGKIKAFKLLNIAGRLLAGRREESAAAAHLRDVVLLEERPRRLSEQALKRPRSATIACWASNSICFRSRNLPGRDCIFWHPKGGIIRKEMEDWMRDQYLKRGYSLVYTPHVARDSCSHTSGHEGYYAQNMFDVMELDDAGISPEAR